MNTFTLLLAALGIGIVVAEGILWFLFRMKAAPILFPHETDASSLRFFTPNRLRVLAFLHTLLLSLVIGFSFFLLW